MVDAIRSLCKEQNLTIKELERRANLSNGVIKKWDNNTPSVDKVARVARVLGVSIDSLCGLNMPAAPADPLAADLAKLDAHGRELVKAIIGVELKREEPKIVEMKVIPLFAAAAGPGEPIDGEPLDEYEVPADSPAQFAVSISGDSMEPVLHDGEVVLCRRKRPQDGDIAVINVNGFMLVKQYIEDYYGNIYLRSINRARKNLDVDILASGNDTAVGYGTVIHKKIGLVRE